MADQKIPPPAPPAVLAAPSPSAPPASPASPGPGPSETIRRIGVVSWSLLGLLVLFGVLGFLLWSVRQVFPPLIFAVMLIFLLNPLVSRLERRGIRRSIATAGIYLMFIGVVAATVMLIWPVFAEQVRALGQRLPELEAKAYQAIGSIGERFGAGGLSDERIRSQLTEVRGRLFSSLGQVTRFAQGALHVLVAFVLAPILALYLLIDLPKLQRAAVHYMPPRYRDEWTMLLRRCGAAVGGFFRGQLLVALIVGVMSAIAFLLIGLPFWLPLGMLAGFTNLIPLIGPFIGGAAAVVVGVATGGWDQAAWAAGAMVVVQQTDNHLISPKIMGRAAQLHPVVVIISLLAGGALAGLLGMLMAVPTAAVARIIGVHFYETRVLHHPEMQVEPEPEAPVARRLRTGVGFRMRRREASE